MALSNAELACVYAALILVDDEVAITVSLIKLCLSVETAELICRKGFFSGIFLTSLLICLISGWKNRHFAEGCQRWCWALLAESLR